MIKKTVVSIILPTYNRASLILKAIQSVQNQTFTDWELLVIDDKSNDNTIDVIKALAKEDDRIKYIYNDGVKGVSGARNTGLKYITGQYVAFIDSDDVWYNFHLEQSIRILKKENIKVSLSFWDSCLNGVTSCFLKLPEEQEICSMAVKDLNAKETEEYYLFGSNFYEYLFTSDLYCYCINTMVVHREVVEKVGLFDESLKIHEDTDFSIRVFKHYGFSLIKKSSFLYNMGNDDHLFGFLDRCELVEKLISMKNPGSVINNILLKQLLASSHSTVKFVLLKMKYIREFSDKALIEETLKTLKQRGAVFCFTLGYLSLGRDFKSSFHYFLQSLKFRWDKLTFFYIVKSLIPCSFPGIKKHTHNFALHT